MKEVTLTRQEVVDILEKIRQVKVCLVGDICLDLYWRADMKKSRLSRETPHYPLPIVDETYTPGAGGNVLNNIHALDVENITCISAIGSDWRGFLLTSWMKEHGIATSMDLAAVDPNSAAGKADWKKILARVLPDTDFFVPSFEELCFMLNRPRYDALCQAGGDMAANLDMEADVKPLAEQCLALGCKAVLVKCGTSGMYYRTGDAQAIAQVGARIGLDVAAWANREGIQRCFRADQVLSGTGAGDTSIAAFLAAALEGKAPSECAALAAAEGSCAVTTYDALSGLKTLRQLEERIAAGWDRM